MPPSVVFYSPGGVDKIFESCLPVDFEFLAEQNLFPPLKKLTMPQVTGDNNTIQINLNSFDLSKREVLENILSKLKNVSDDCGEPIPHVEHFINTGNHELISGPPNRLAPVTKEKLLKYLVKNKIIEEKESPWAFPVLLIPKKTDSRLKCNYDNR